MDTRFLGLAIVAFCLLALGVCFERISDSSLPGGEITEGDALKVVFATNTNPGPTMGNNCTVGSGSFPPCSSAGGPCGNYNSSQTGGQESLCTGVAQNQPSQVKLYTCANISQQTCRLATTGPNAGSYYCSSSTMITVAAGVRQVCTIQGSLPPEP